MKRELALEFARVTEAAALAAHKWVGRGKKESADQAGVDAMRTMLNRLAIDGEIVIGEGEIDEAPMLYIGEKVGLIYNEEEKDSVTYVDPVDIAVDPVEGTRMTAQGQPNAITVLAVGKKGSFLKAPDMYMEKIIVGPEAKGKIDLSKPLEDNIHAVAKALNKELKDLMIVILDKPRHKELIKDLQAMGIKVYALPDGDVAGSILTCMIDSDVDMLYGIGGAPEGVISAAVIRALGGDMQARLKLRSEVKGASLENDKISKFEKLRCEEQGLKVGEILKLEDLAKDDEIIFSATGITGGDLLEGVKRKGSIARTQTLVVRGLSKTVRYINSIHNLDFKDEKILLVHENDGKWSLPGGWVDVNVSVGENVVKEVKEESGLDVITEKVIAIQDRSKHNLPVYAYGICKIFVQCSVIGGKFEENNETTEYRYFSISELPELATEKNTVEQIKMCFEAYKSDNWKTLLD